MDSYSEGFDFCLGRVQRPQVVHDLNQQLEGVRGHGGRHYHIEVLRVSEEETAAKQNVTAPRYPEVLEQDRT